MSDGADSVAHTRENSLTSSVDEEDGCDATIETSTASPAPTLSSPTSPPPTAYTGRRPRFGTGSVPPSPYVWIDGRQLRSALAWTKKWPPRRVSFPSSDSHLVTGYLEPANPWRHAENVSRDDLIFAYKESCARHSTEPLHNVLVQLENLDISQDRCAELNLKGETLDQDHSEPLEEILKRVQFNKINLEGTSLNDESSVILFDMLEYYESAKQLNISSNPEIGARGWQACSRMIKKTQCLEHLEARDIIFNEQYMNILHRALRLVCHLHVLKLENCGLSGRAIVTLVTALKMNNGIRELYLADNGLDLYDAIQLGSLLRMNNHLQLLDISNNNIQDDGVRDILEGLINQVNEDKTGKGISVLILWNNRLTKKSAPYFARIVALSKTLETLNIGQNMLTDETLSIVTESLKKNRVLLQLGMQSTELTCDGIITLAEIMETNQVLQRIDLRDNSIQMSGMRALINVMKKNKNITQIDLDDKPRIKIDVPLHQYMELVTEIRNRCNQNEECRLLEESIEDTESPQHPSRLPNASSRKISLTCQTLPCPSRPAASLAADEPPRIMLEPKRTSGGRLRSPAPSPIPSPVASPIPSPSRNRFVVSRVPEASLRSTESSASSSPVTPPSLGSSPTCFFPGTSSQSRFRVSIVESVNTDCSTPRSVITSPNGNVTIGFNFKVDAIESADSDDSDNVTKTGTVMQDVSDNAFVSVDTFNIVPIAKEISCKEVIKCEDSDETTKSEEAQLDECIIKTQFEIRENVTRVDKCNHPMKVEGTELIQDKFEILSRKSEDVKEIYEDCRDEMVNKNNSRTKTDLEYIIPADTEFIADQHTYTSTNELQLPAYSEENITTPKVSHIEDSTLNCVTKSSLDDNSRPSIDWTSESFPNCAVEHSANTVLETSPGHVTDSYPQERVNKSVQRHKSNLEKLLSLFQHPGQLFSEPSNVDIDTKNSLQENISGVMALGDKLQQYLKENRTKVNSDDWSSEYASSSKNKSVRLNMSQLQNFTEILTSFKPEPYTNFVEHGIKFFNQAKNQRINTIEKELRKSSEIEIAIDDKNVFCQENKEITKNDTKHLVNQITKSDEEISVQSMNQSIKYDEKNSNDQENCDYVEQNVLSDQMKNKENIISQEKNHVARNDENNLFDQSKDQIMICNEPNLFGQKDKQNVNSDDESNLFDLKGNKIANNDESNLIDKTKNQIEKYDVQNDQNHEEHQVVKNNENNLFEKKNHILNNNKQELEKQSETDLGDQKGNQVGANDEKNSIDTQDICIKTEEIAPSIDKLLSVEYNQSDRALPECVQSKNNFADKDLVLDNDCVVTASKSSTYITTKLTDIPEYSVLELSQTDGIGCYDATNLECNGAKYSQSFEHFDYINESQQECNDVPNLERLERDNSEGLQYNKIDSLERDGADEEINAVKIKRTCDTTTTDSINQTSDSSFPICNIACDRKVVDNVSTASVSTSNVGTDIRTSSAATDNVSALSILSEDVDASVHLNDEVTNSTRCVVEEDHQNDSTNHKENPAKILDDAYCTSAHCRSTSVNIKIVSRESDVNSDVRNQDAPEALREQQSLVPNNIDIYRISSEHAVDVQLPEAAIDEDRPNDLTVFVTPYEISTSPDKSDVEELIFCMTDISTNCTSVEDNLSTGIASRSSPNDATKIAESYFELPVATLMTTLLIENPEGIHRNSQDSGIEEPVLAIDDGVTMDTHPLPPPRESLQKSVDSGIESECSSICVRVETSIEESLETGATLKRSSHADSVSEKDDNDAAGENNGGDVDNNFVNFASDFFAKEVQLIDNDNMSDIPRSYLNNIKCAVINPTRPIDEIASGASLEIIGADEGVARSATAVITHSPAAMHGTSPK